jgi:hypothetical protein
LLPLLTDAPLEVARQAEDTLSVVAGDKPPQTPLGEKDKEREKCREAWEGWWKANGDKLDLAKANIDLPWLTIGQQARSATQKFIDAILKGDLAGLKGCTDAPFSMGGEMTFKTRDELHKFLEEMSRNRPNQPKFKVTIDKIAILTDYLKTVQGAEKEFLSGLPRTEVRAVYVTAEEEGQKRKEPAVLFVRVRGGRGKVVGIGNPARNQRIEKKEIKPPEAKPK